MNVEELINRNSSVQSSLDEINRHRELQAILHPTNEPTEEDLQRDIFEKERKLHELQALDANIKQ